MTKYVIHKISYKVLQIFFFDDLQLNYPKLQSIDIDYRMLIY